MKYLETPHEKKSAALTLVIAVLLLLLFSVIGFKYFDPPISYGMEVNFGTSNVGSGKAPANPSPAQRPQPTPVREEPTPVKPKVQKTTPKVLTQEAPSVPVVAEKKKTSPQKPKPKKTTPQAKPPPPKPTVADKTKSVLSNMLSAKKPVQSSKGEGNDTAPGDKGQAEGNPYASSYYGKAGLGGSGKGYGLSGRNLQTNGKVTQDCNEEGTVVVRITVNQQGEVVDAEPGVRGSTNVHPCLLAPAKATAFMHKWYPDSNAPDTQIGFVVINFKLSE